MQRNGVYEERKRILKKQNLRPWVIEYAERTLYDLVLYARENDQLQMGSMLALKMQELLGLPFKLNFPTITNDNNAQIISFLQLQFQIRYSLKEVEYSWKDHLQKISALRESIRWRAYGQKDPLTEYKREAYNFFITTMTQIRHRVVYFISRSEIKL